MHEQDMKIGFFLKGEKDIHGIKPYIQGNLIFPPAGQGWLVFFSFFSLRIIVSQL